MPTLTAAAQHVHVLDLGDGENRFTPAWVDEVASCLDEVEQQGRPAALVTSASGKFWSNGLDLEWMLSTPGEADQFLRSVQTLLARFLTSPVPNVAAVQGHAFAAGAMLALAHDQRVMRRDRGFWCLPEIDIDIPFTIGMSDLIRSKLSPAVAHAAMTTGRRYTGPDAVEAGIADAVEEEDRVLEAAIERAAADADRAGTTLATMKRSLYAPAEQSLREGPAHLAPPAGDRA